MAIHRSARRRGADGRGGGFTIIEMMITIMILGIIISSFSAVIVQCHRVVTTAEIIIRANAKISAIAQILRRDARRVTKGGILAITQTTTGPPALVITTSEPMTTVKSATDCLGSYVVYGLRQNNAEVFASNAGDPETFILWRPEYGFATGGRLTPVDVMGIRLGPGDNGVLGKIQSYSRAKASTEVTRLVSSGGDNLYMPPENLTEINELWQILTENCSELTIMWSDGSVDPASGAINWYGVETHPNGTTTVHSKSGAWMGSSASSGEPEFASTGGYRAMWTSDDTSGWPKAIMVRFRLTDPHLPEGMTTTPYEIICELPP